MPSETRYRTVADSELGPFLQSLRAAPGYTPLFSDNGMALLRDQDKNALVLSEKAKPTLAGILGALSTRFALRLIDSPPALSSHERGIFTANGLTVEQDTGTGIMIDFAVASGTKGNVLSLESLITDAAQQGIDSKLVLPALRSMLNHAYLLPSEGGSLSANFVNNTAVKQAFVRALQRVSCLQDSNELLLEPYRPKDQKRAIVRSIVEPLLAKTGLSSKPTTEQLSKLFGQLPLLRTMFSPELAKFATINSSRQTIPKQLLKPSDRQLVQALITANPDRVIPLIVSHDDQLFADIVSKSQLPTVAGQMGYSHTVANLRTLLNKLQSVKGIYKL